MTPGQIAFEAYCKYLHDHGVVIAKSWDASYKEAWEAGAEAVLEHRAIIMGGVSAGRPAGCNYNDDSGSCLCGCGSDPEEPAPDNCPFDAMVNKD